MSTEPILEVGGTMVYMDYFVKRLRLRYLQLRAQGQPFDGGVEPFRLLFNLSGEVLLRQAESQFHLQVPSEAIDKAILAQFGTSENSGTMTGEMARRFQEELTGSALTEREYRQMVESQLLTAELDIHLREHAPAAAAQARVQIILLNREEEAQQALARIQSGEDFTELAQKLSRDQDSASQGGHVGWVPQGVFGPAFDQVAFTLQPGNIGGPVASKEGYYLLRVLGREDDRLVSPENLSRLQANALEYWLEKERGKGQIRYHFDSTKYDFALQHLAVREPSP